MGVTLFKKFSPSSMAGSRCFEPLPGLLMGWALSLPSSPVTPHGVLRTLQMYKIGMSLSFLILFLLPV